MSTLLVITPDGYVQLSGSQETNLARNHVKKNSNGSNDKPILWRCDARGNLSKFEDPNQSGFRLIMRLKEYEEATANKRAIPTKRNKPTPVQTTDWEMRIAKQADDLDVMEERMRAAEMKVTALSNENWHLKLEIARKDGKVEMLKEMLKGA